jgi:hypothetical protein
MQQQHRVDRGQGCSSGSVLHILPDPCRGGVRSGSVGLGADPYGLEADPRALLSEKRIRPAPLSVKRIREVSVAHRHLGAHHEKGVRGFAQVRPSLPPARTLSPPISIDNRVASINASSHPRMNACHR